MAYQLKTYQNAARLPKDFPARKKAMKAARAELLSAGCELRHGVGDGIAGWGRFWFTKAGERICHRPNMSALDTVIQLRLQIRNQERHHA